MTITLRPTTPADAEALSHICFNAFRTVSGAHAMPPDFPQVEQARGLMDFVLNKQDVYGVAAEVAGKLAGSAFTWENGTIHGIGPVTVDPTVQNGSVGRKMMEHLLERAESKRVAGIRLVQAAYHTRSLSLYSKLGFEVREPLACMNGDLPRITIPGRTVRAATMKDVGKACGLCCRVHGHDRRDELEGGIAQGNALVVEHDGRITGYTSGVGFFGHIVGQTSDDVKAILGAAPAIAGPGFLLPTRQADLFRWCLAHGLRVTQAMTLMSMGLYQEPAGAFCVSILY